MNFEMKTSPTNQTQEVSDKVHDSLPVPLQDPLLAMEWNRTLKRIQSMRGELVRIGEVLDRAESSGRGLCAAADTRPVEMAQVATAYASFFEAMMEMPGHQMNPQPMEGLPYQAGLLRADGQSLKSGAEGVARMEAEQRHRQERADAERQARDASDRAEGNRIKNLLAKAD